MSQKLAASPAEASNSSIGSVMACAWPALLVATVCLLPFVNKPFLIDDPEFLAMARQIMQRPLHPMDFDLCWNVVENCTKAYHLMPGNVLMGYALVPTVLGGASEWMAHLTQLAFAWVAIIAMSSLVLRFGWGRPYAVVGALLLVAIPPFLPMASTAMPDVLATAVGLVGIERLAAWKAERKRSQGVAAALALGLAGIARPHLALLLPLGAFYLAEIASPRAMLDQIRRKMAIWTPIIGGVALLLAVILITRERSMALDPPPAFSGTANIRPNLFAYLRYLAFPLPLAACWAASRWKTNPRRVGIILVSAAGAAGLRVIAGGAGSTALATVGLPLFLTVTSLGMLIDLLVEALRCWDHESLFLSLWLLAPLPIVYYGHLPIKYLLPCVPALILTCFRLTQAIPARAAGIAGAFIIVAGIGYSLLILRSDAEFANFGRTALYRLIGSHVAAGETVWYGQQYSSYWYAPKAGARLSFPGGPQPKPGDLLAVGLSEGGFVMQRFPNRTLVASLACTYSFGRTMGAGKGLYSNRVGIWPWGFGSSEFDRYELWRIEDSGGVR
jgi:hypothetical protein